MILVLDNYDSFTWNLVDLVRRHGPDVWVKRNDEITIDEIEKLNPDGILISPGPGKPMDSGVCPSVINKFSKKIPMLGICLGHQLLGEYFGVKVIHANEPMHGKTTYIQHDQKGLFEGIPDPFKVMRYHSLVLNNEFPEHSFELTAWTAAGEVMGIRHKALNLSGLQFHPESILTEYGSRIMKNWLSTLNI